MDNELYNCNSNEFLNLIRKNILRKTTFCKQYLEFTRCCFSEYVFSYILLNCLLVMVSEPYLLSTMVKDKHEQAINFTLRLFIGKELYNLLSDVSLCKL